MKKVVNKNIFGVVSLLTFMRFCMTLTKPIQSESTLNECVNGAISNHLCL